MAGIEGLMPMLLNQGVGYMNQVSDRQRAASEAEAARRHAAEEAERQRQFAALEAERQRQHELRILAAQPVPEPDPGLERQRKETLIAADQDRSQRQRSLREAQAGERARAASAGIAGGQSAKAIQRSLIERSRKDAGYSEAFTAARLEEQRKRHAQNLLDATEQRRRAALGLSSQLARRTGY